MQIPVQVVGRVISGNDSCRFVKVLPDDEGGDGYYVLTAMNDAFDPCFDDWVENEADLAVYFDGWSIKWR